MLTAEHVRDGAVVIDVGINRLEKGLVGDVDFASVAPKAPADHAGARAASGR